MIEKKTVEDWLRQRAKLIKTMNCAPAGYSDNEFTDSEEDDCYSLSPRECSEPLENGSPFYPTTTAGVRVRVSLIFLVLILFLYLQLYTYNMWD